MDNGKCNHTLFMYKCIVRLMDKKMRTNTELESALHILENIPSPTVYNNADVELIRKSMCGDPLTQLDIDTCETGCANWIMDIDESGYWVFWEMQHSLTNVEPDTTNTVAQKDGFSNGGAG